jgi:hypothetical protein
MRREKYLIVDIECARCLPYLSLRASAKQSHSGDVRWLNSGKERCAGRTLGLRSISFFADIFNLFSHSFQQARIVKASASHRCSVNNKTIVF